MTTVACPSLTSLSQRLTLILGSLRAVIASRGGRDGAAVPFLPLVWTRLGRMAVRFEALVARLVAGRLAAKRVRGKRAARTMDCRGDGLRLPTGFAWLVGLTQETGAYRGHVEALLADPEMAVLLAAAPNAGRVLRPLCRMLGIEPGPTLGALYTTEAQSAAAGRMTRALDRITRSVLGHRPPAISQFWTAVRDAAAAVTPEGFARAPPDEDQRLRALRIAGLAMVR